VFGISLLQRGQLKPHVFWSVVGEVFHGNATFGLSVRPEVSLDNIRMRAGHGRHRTKGRSLNVLRAIKNSIVTVKAAVKCLAYALINAMVRVSGDPKYQLYMHGKGEKMLKIS